MKRSGGVTFSAIVVLITCSFIFLGAVVDMLVFMFAPQIEGQPPAARYFLIVGIVFILGFVGWGVATGVDLLRLKAWARISMMVFCGLLLCACIPAMLLFAFMPLPIPQDPNLPGNFPLMLRVGMCGFYGLIIVTAGLWLYYFNRKSVKEQFLGGMLTQYSTPSKRPLSISIIGWFTLIGSCFVPFMLLVPAPALFLGSMIGGPRKVVFFLVMWAAQLLSGIGLLKLKPWGRMLTIYLLSFGILNILVSTLLHGSREMFDAAMAATMSAMGNPPNPIILPFWVYLFAGLPIIIVEMWFVVTRKKAFERDPEVSLPGPQPIS